MRFGILVSLIVLGLDQLTKLWMWDLLFEHGRQIKLAPFLNLTPVLNQGISFGLFPATSPASVAFLILFALLMILILIWWLKSLKEPESQFALGLIIGGAMGNLIDRIRLRGVIDFLDFHVAEYHWPAFNIADAGITLGILILVYEHFTKPAQQAKT